MLSSQRQEEVSACLSVLGAAFSSDPAKAEHAGYYEGLARLAEEGDWPCGSSEEVGRAFSLMVHGMEDRGSMRRAYQRLFVGPGHIAAPPWGSVYLDRSCVLYGSSLFDLREWMHAHGIEVRWNKKEPEDHVGTLLLLAGWVMQEKPSLLTELLSEHILPWLPTFLDEFEKSADNSFYEGLARLTRKTIAAIAQEVGAQAVPKRIYFEGRA